MPVLVTITTYNDAMSATFAQHHLAEHGINSYLADEAATAHCPSCGSNNTTVTKQIRQILWWTWLLLGVPLLWASKRQRHCFSCGHDWKA